MGLKVTQIGHEGAEAQSISSYFFASLRLRVEQMDTFSLIPQIPAELVKSTVIHLDGLETLRVFSY